MKATRAPDAPSWPNQGRSRAYTHSIVIGLALATLATACARRESTTNDSAQAANAIMSKAHAIATAFNNRDAAGVTRYDAESVVVMISGENNIEGPDAELALTKQQISDPAAKFEVSNEHVDVARSGDLAVYRADYAYTFTDPKTLADCGARQLVTRIQAKAWGRLADRMERVVRRDASLGSFGQP